MISKKVKERIPFIIGFINYILIFLFPKYFILGVFIFIASLIFVWAYRTTVIEKILFTLAPLLYLFIPRIDLYHIVEEKCRFYNSQKIDFIFPESFNGNAVIVTEKKCGQDIILKKGYVKLYIPSSGVLFYKGIVKNYDENYCFRYFQITKNDTIEIPSKYIGSRLNPIKSDKKVIYADATLNKDKNLSKILLYIYSINEDVNIKDSLIKKEYECK